MIARHKHVLRNTFGQGTVSVSVEEWSKVCAEVTGLMLDWHALQPMLVPHNAVLSSGDIHCEKFLAHYQLSTTHKSHEIHDGGAMLTTLYRRLPHIRALFSLMDVDNSGSIDRAEFEKCCNWVNDSMLDGSEERVDGMALFDHIDIDRSGSIDLNELAECFRIECEHNNNMDD